MATPERSEPIRFVETPQAIGTYQPAFLEREVEVYPLAENELGQISSTNWLTTLFFSAAFAFLSTGVSFLIARLSLPDDADGSVKGAFTAVFPLAFLISIVFFIAAGIAWKTGQSTLERLKKECKRPGTLVSQSKSVEVFTK